MQELTITDAGRDALAAPSALDHYRVRMNLTVAREGEVDFNTGMDLAADVHVVMVPTWDVDRQAVWAMPCPWCHVSRGSLYFLVWNQERQHVSCEKCSTVFEGIEV